MTTTTFQTLFLLITLCLLYTTASDADDPLAAKCGAEFQKVTPCLPFATAKAAAPTKDCCDNVTDLKNSDPACICFIIQQIHAGTNDAVKSLGVQESRLLQLPTSCHMTNASMSECPKLLHLPANSPDAAIFTNATSAVVGPSPPAAGGGGAGGSTGAAATASNDRGSGVWRKPEVAVSLLFTGVALLVGFPGGRSLVPAN